MLKLLFQAVAKFLPKTFANSAKVTATAGRTTGAALKTPLTTTASTTARNAALSQTDKMAMSSVKFSQVLKFGIAGTIAAEIYSGGIITTNATKAAIELEGWLREQELPGAADFVKDKGLAAFSILGSIGDLPRDSFTRASATYFDMKGMPEEANAIRILNSITKPMSAAITVIGADKGQQAQEYINWLIADSGVAEEDIGAFLQKNPDIVSTLKNNPIQSVDLTIQFPKLANTATAPALAGATLINTDKITAAAQDAFATVKETATSALMNQFSAAAMFIVNIIKSIYDFFTSDQKNGDLISQTPKTTNPLNNFEMNDLAFNNMP